jgi:selenocysteine lyase/cysteine desulfurase
VDRLHHGTPTLSPAADKYEGGGLPFHLLYGMEAAVDWINEIGSETIEERVLALAEAVRTMLAQLGGDLGPAGSQIVTAHFPGVDAEELVRTLKRQRVVIAARHGRLRVSPHFYNNEEDIARLEEALRRLL